MTSYTQDQLDTIEAIKVSPQGCRWLHADIRELPTIHSGHFDNLKLEWSTSRSQYRLWVSRMTIADGADKDHQIILEHKYNDPNEGRTLGTSLGEFPRGSWRQFPKS